MYGTVAEQVDVGNTARIIQSEAKPDNCCCVLMVVMQVRILPVPIYLSCERQVKTMKRSRDKPYKSFLIFDL